MDKNIENPLVSIILPAYNVEPFIKTAIDSVLKQTYKNFELIVIDDGSKDKTITQIKSISDSRIRFEKNESNIGIQKTLNKGLKLSNGYYIARIDGDDEWTDLDKIKKQISFLEKNKEYILIGTGAICINEKGNYLYKYLKPETDAEIRKSIIGKNCFIHSSVVFRKKPILKIGGYSENTESKHVEDYDLWLRVGRIGKFYNIPECSIKYMIRRESVGNKNIINQLRANIKISKKYKKYYKKNATKNMIRNYLRLLIYGYIKPSIKKLIP